MSQEEEKDGNVPEETIGQNLSPDENYLTFAADAEVADINSNPQIR